MHVCVAQDSSLAMVSLVASILVHCCMFIADYYCVVTPYCVVCRLFMSGLLVAPAVLSLAFIVCVYDVFVDLSCVMLSSIV
jgi:hypothetical protein